MAKAKTIQGVSQVTAAKEEGIEGISGMRFTQFKTQDLESKGHKIQKILCADVFSGSGTNEVAGEIIEGSPIRLLQAYKLAANRGVPMNKAFSFYFSDTRKQAVSYLDNHIKQDFGDSLKMYLRVINASEAVKKLDAHLTKNKDTYLYLVLDPNGPKDFPKFEVEELLRRHSHRVDVVPNISATAINRCIGARNKAGMEFKGWINDVENFDSGFIASLVVNGRNGWIRRPISGDPQRWTIIPTFGWAPPRYAWEKKGYVGLRTEEAKAIIKSYCGEKNNGQ